MNAKNEPGLADWTDPDDAPELTAEMLERAEVFRGDTFVRRGRGRPLTGNAKEQVSVRLDRDVLAKLREAGPGWQSQVNLLLRTALGFDVPAGVREGATRTVHNPPPIAGGSDRVRKPVSSKSRQGAS